MEAVGKDLSILAVVVVPLIGLVVWVMKTLMGQVCDALRPLEAFMIRSADQHLALMEQHERIIASQDAMVQALNGKPKT